MAAARGLPPGPRWPVAVQTLRYGIDPCGLFASAQRAFGDVFLDSGVANMALRPLIGVRSVLLLDGRASAPPDYEELVREATRREIATWPPGEPVATLPRMQAITL